MKEAGLKEPVFADDRGTFAVTLYNERLLPPIEFEKKGELLQFLETPRSRQEIADYLGIGTVSYAIQTYIKPLVEEGAVKPTIPDKPRSQKQKYVRNKR